MSELGPHSHIAHTTRRGATLRYKKQHFRDFLWVFFMLHAILWLCVNAALRMYVILMIKQIFIQQLKAIKSIGTGIC